MAQQQEQEIPFPGEVPPESYAGTGFEPPPRQPTAKTPIELRERAKPPAKPSGPRLPVASDIASPSELSARVAQMRARPEFAGNRPPPPGAIGPTMTDVARGKINAWDEYSKRHWVPGPETAATMAGMVAGGLAGGPLGAGVGGGATYQLFNRLMGRDPTIRGTLETVATGVAQEFGARYITRVPGMVGTALKTAISSDRVAPVIMTMIGSQIGEMLGVPRMAELSIELVAGLGTIVAEKMLNQEWFKLLPKATQKVVMDGVLIADHFIQAHPEVIQNLGRLSGNVSARAAIGAGRVGEKAVEALEPQDTTAGPNWQWHYAKPGAEGGYVTRLTPPEEREFRQWIKDNNIPFDSGPTSDYDMRGFWRSGATFEVGPGGNLRYPDQWKTPYNPSFNRKSMYASSNAPEMNSKGQVIDDRGRVLFDPEKKKSGSKSSSSTSERTSEPTPQATGPPGEVSDDLLYRLAGAIAKAEGFDVEGSIPQRYNNPGNLTDPQDIGLGMIRHFSTPEEGWYELYDQLRKMFDGRSKRYNPSMTLAEVGSIYAGDRSWAINVAKELGVSPQTTLAELAHASNAQ